MTPHYRAYLWPPIGDTKASGFVTFKRRCRLKAPQFVGLYHTREEAEKAAQQAVQDFKEIH